MKPSAFAAVLVAAFVFPAAALPARASSAPLDYRAYDGWNAIVAPRLSDDGRWLIYTQTPEDGDPTLVARDLTSGKEWREPRGADGSFVGASHVVYAVRPPKRDVDAARKAGKKDDDLPQGDGAILDLATGAVITVARVDRIVVPVHAARWAAFRHVAAATASPSPAPSRAAATPSPRPTGEETPPASPAPSISPSPSPSAAATPKALDKTKAPAAEAELHDVETGTVVRIAAVSEIVANDDGAVFAYATQTPAGDGDGVHVRHTGGGAAADVATGAGRYRRLALSRDGASLAFLSDRETYATAGPHDVAYLADLSVAAPAARKILDLGDGALPAGWAPDANGTVAFDRDGRRLRLGTARAATPQPTTTPQPMKVEQWSWNDPVLPSQQRHDADRERTRTYAGSYDLAARRYVQVATALRRDAAFADGADVALAFDSRPYAVEASWTGESARDVYAVPLDGRPVRRIATKAVQAELSPGGRYALVWDEGARRWAAIDTATGRRALLAPDARVSFADEEDDHPAPPPPYGVGGWLRDDRGVLLYDRYDVWLADPATGAARNLTAGAGRRAKLVYSPLQTDPEARAFDPSRPFLMSLYDEARMDQGYARMPAAGGAPVTLLRLPKAVGLAQAQSPYTSHHERVVAPLRARNADRYVYSLEDTRNFRDLYASDGTFQAPLRVSDANPQQARYRWANDRLLFYTAADGQRLRAILYTPDGFDPKRDRLPLLITFYERFSDTFHVYNTPAPGTSPTRIRYVSNGYAVLVADVRYRRGHPGASALAAIRAAADAAVRSGGIDPKRIGLAGHSWGAYQINYIITREHRFRAVEAGAAVDDMISAYGGIRLESGIVREGQYEHGQSRIGAPPWARPDLYVENSGIFRASAVTTPYLTIHDDADGAVPQNQGIEWITAMRRLGKTAYLFSFDGEDHNLRGREQQKWWTVHLDEWFDYWLKGSPPPAWFAPSDWLHRGERDVHPLFGEPD